MRHAQLVTLAITLFVALPRPADAQTIPSPYEYVETRHSAGATLGYSHFSGGRYDVGPEPGPALGLDYGYRFAGPLTGTLGVSLVPTSRPVLERVAISPDSAVLEPIGSADLLIGMAEAGLRFNITGERTWHRLAPYAGATVGIMGNLRARPALEGEIEGAQRVSIGPSFAIGLSLGTDWFLTERMSLRAELRDHLWRLATPEGLTPTQERHSGWTQNPGIAIGAALHF